MWGKACCYTYFMRHSFTLQLEYGGVLQGQEKLQLKEEIATLATVQDMHSFGYEDDTFGRYVFFAVPSIVAVHKDYYEVSSFRILLNQWLERHKKVERFESSQLFELSEITPKVGTSEAIMPPSSSNYLRLRN